MRCPHAHYVSDIIEGIHQVRNSASVSYVDRVSLIISEDSGETDNAGVAAVRFCCSIHAETMGFEMGSSVGSPRLERPDSPGISSRASITSTGFRNPGALLQNGYEIGFCLSKFDLHQMWRHHAMVIMCPRAAWLINQG